MSADNLEATEDPLQNLQSRRVDENEEDDGAVVDYRRMLGYLLSVPIPGLTLVGRARKMRTKYPREVKRTLNQMAHENSKISFKKHEMLCTKLFLQILDCTFFVRRFLMQGNKERHVVCG